jgi:hypothetical protein
MASWVFIVFLLGLLALIFNLFDVFQWFTPWWGVILMIISFGMLTRIYQKEKEGEKEKLRERLQELEALTKF